MPSTGTPSSNVKLTLTRKIANMLMISLGASGILATNLQYLPDNHCFSGGRTMEWLLTTLILTWRTRAILQMQGALEGSTRRAQTMSAAASGTHASLPSDSSM